MTSALANYTTEAVQPLLNLTLSTLALFLRTSIPTIETPMLASILLLVSQGTTRRSQILITTPGDNSVHFANIKENISKILVENVSITTLQMLTQGRDSILDLRSGKTVSVPGSPTSGTSPRSHNTSSPERPQTPTNPEFLLISEAATSPSQLHDRSQAISSLKKVLFRKDDDMEMEAPDNRRVGPQVISWDPLPTAEAWLSLRPPDLATLEVDKGQALRLALGPEGQRNRATHRTGKAPSQFSTGTCIMLQITQSGHKSHPSPQNERDIHRTYEGIADGIRRRWGRLTGHLPVGFYPTTTSKADLQWNTELPIDRRWRALYRTATARKGPEAIADISSKQTLQNESGTSDDEGVGESGILTKLKIARQEAIVQQLSAGMTEEQLEEEKEMEKQQLEAILQLLRQQEEKFQVGSMEELEDQLRLYRK
uniref:Matrix-remodeling-associated protein 7 helical domain-containing protein n=1 Tax=Timema poppense TaxID=170557 RepID=A0A7R9D0Z0_TIMPO|nr:unnamed protein product [Timema poppensis]